MNTTTTSPVNLKGTLSASLWASHAIISEYGDNYCQVKPVYSNHLWVTKKWSLNGGGLFMYRGRNQIYNQKEKWSQGGLLIQNLY